MGKIICVGTHKGGSGKTTISTNIAFGLALKNKSVCLIDIDGQSNVATTLGINNTDNVNHSLLSVCLKEIELPEVVKPINDVLDIIYADYSMNLFDHYANKDKKVLSNYLKILEHLKNIYDYLVIDMSPSLSLLNFKTLSVADELILPFSMDRQDIQGMISFLEELEDSKYKHLVKVMLANKYTNRFSIDKKIVSEAELLSTKFKNTKIFNTKIPNSSLFKKIPLTENVPLIVSKSNSKQTLQQKEIINNLLNEIM